MMRAILLVLTVVFSSAIGCCRVPTTPMIAKNSERDFGFVGNWQVVPRPGASPVGPITTITRDESNDRYNLKSSDEELYGWSFRVDEISPQHTQALVEVEVAEKGIVGWRVQAVAEVKDEHLYVWHVNVDKLIKLLESQQITYSLGNKKNITELTCEPESLKAVLRANWANLIDVQENIFRRVGQ